MNKKNRNEIISWAYLGYVAVSLVFAGLVWLMDQVFWFLIIGSLVRIPDGIISLFFFVVGTSPLFLVVGFVLLKKRFVPRKAVLVATVLNILLVVGLVLIIVDLVDDLPAPAQLRSSTARDQITVSITKSFVWLDEMPVEPPSKNIVITVRVKNNRDVDLLNLSIDRAEIMRGNDVVGEFHPVFYMNKNCNRVFDHWQYADSVDLLSGCELSLDIRTRRGLMEGASSNILPDFDELIRENETIWVRFKFIGDDYYSETYETEEMTVVRTS